MSDALLDSRSLRGDVLGGLSAAAVTLPMALGYGLISGLGVEAGIISVVFVSLMSGLVGGTRNMISAPTGPVAMLSAGVAASVLEATDAGMAVVVATFALAGLFQVIFGLTRIAKYVKFVPYPVISGFTSGIGVIIIALQIFPLFGAPSPGGIMSVFREIDSLPDLVNLEDLGLGAGTIVLFYAFQGIDKRMPIIIITMALATVVSVIIDADVTRIGNISAGLPEFQLSRLSELSWEQMGTVASSAFTIAAVATVGALMTALSADHIAGTKHDGNRELLGQGLGNLASSLFGGMPSTGAMSGTMVNIYNGGSSRVAILTNAGVVFGLLFLAGGAMEVIPKSVIAGVLITIGIRIIDFNGIRLIFFSPKGEGFILLVTLLLTVFDDLLNAVTIGVLLATVLFMHKMSSVLEGLKKEKDLDKAVRRHKLPPELVEKVHLMTLDGPMFFGVSDNFDKYVKSIDHVWALIIDMSAVPFMDETGLRTIEKTIVYLKKENIQVYITGCNDAIYSQFEENGIPGGLVSESNFFPSVRPLLKMLRHELGDRLKEEQLARDRREALKSFKTDEDTEEVD